MDHPRISGVIDMRHRTKITDEEIVIVDEKTPFINIPKYEVIDNMGGCLIFIKLDLMDSSKISRLKNGGISISFDRPWYVLDYKYIFETNNGNLEYDKISSGRYFTHSEKASKHVFLYTFIICIVTVMFLLV